MIYQSKEGFEPIEWAFSLFFQGWPREGRGKRENQPMRPTCERMFLERIWIDIRALRERERKELESRRPRRWLPLGSTGSADDWLAKDNPVGEKNGSIDGERTVLRFTTKLSITRLCSTSCWWSCLCPAPYMWSTLIIRSDVALRLVRRDRLAISAAEEWFERRKWLRPRRSAENEISTSKEGGVWVETNYRSGRECGCIVPLVRAGLPLAKWHWVIEPDGCARRLMWCCDAKWKKRDDDETSLFFDTNSGRINERWLWNNSDVQQLEMRLVDFRFRSILGRTREEFGRRKKREIWVWSSSGRGDIQTATIGDKVIWAIIHVLTALTFASSLSSNYKKRREEKRRRAACRQNEIDRSIDGHATWPFRHPSRWSVTMRVWEYLPTG